MPNGPISCSVYIWYPDNGHIGHAALYIGNYEVGLKFEMSLDPQSPDYVMPSADEINFNFGGVHFNDNYVSWWPDNGADLLNPNDASKKMSGLYKDVAAEGSPPHVTYDLYGLDVEKMRIKWHSARDKAGSHYKLYRKNCSDMVMRILKAGGATSKLNPVKAAWFGHNAITTPKKVAQLCNELRPDYAVKRRAGNCPPKDSKLMTIVGLR